MYKSRKQQAVSRMLNNTLQVVTLDHGAVTLVDMNQGNRRMYRMTDKWGQVNFIGLGQALKLVKNCQHVGAIDIWLQYKEV